MHGCEDGITSPSYNALPLVLNAIEVFRSVEKSSRIAERGMTMLTELVEGFRRRISGQGQPPKLGRSASHSNRSRDELERALNVLQGSRDKRKSNSGATPPTGSSVISPISGISPPAFAQQSPSQIPSPSIQQQQIQLPSAVTAPPRFDQHLAPPPALPQSPFQWLMMNHNPNNMQLGSNEADPVAIPEFMDMEGFYEWDLDLNWQGEAPTYMPDTAGFQ